MGSAGFHQALAAHQAAAPPNRINPLIAEAKAEERQARARAERMASEAGRRAQ